MFIILRRHREETMSGNENVGIRCGNLRNKCNNLSNNCANCCFKCGNMGSFICDNKCYTLVIFAVLSMLSFTLYELITHSSSIHEASIYIFFAFVFLIIVIILLVACKRIYNRDIAIYSSNRPNNKINDKPNNNPKVTYMNIV